MLEQNMPLIIAIVAFLLLNIFTILYMAKRYKKCPSDKIMVITGRVGEGETMRCLHGGGALIWPLIQDYRYISLTPMTVWISLNDVPTKEDVRVDLDMTFTFGVSTRPDLMPIAAERLVSLAPQEIEKLGEEICCGQLRYTVASLTIEEINGDRQGFFEEIRRIVESDLHKVGLCLINVNVTDISESRN